MVRAVSGPLTLFSRPAVAPRLARIFPGLRIHVFHPHWPAVDDGRRAALAMGLADRVHIHHTSAAEPPAGFTA